MFSTNDIAIPVLQLNSQRWATRIRTSSTGLADGEGALWCWSSLRILMVYHQFPYENDHFEVQYPPCHWSFWDGGNIHPRFGMFCWPFSPQAMAPSHGGTARLGKACTLYITVHGVTTSAILNKHICGLWIISTVLTILTKPDAAHETECSHVNTFVKQVVWTVLYIFPLSPYQCTVDCGICGRGPSAKCGAWRKWSVECGM